MPNFFHSGTDSNTLAKHFAMLPYLRTPKYQTAVENGKNGTTSFSKSTSMRVTRCSFFLGFKSRTSALRLAECKKTCQTDCFRYAGKHLQFWNLHFTPSLTRKCTTSTIAIYRVCLTLMGWRSSRAIGHGSWVTTPRPIAHVIHPKKWPIDPIVCAGWTRVLPYY